MNTELLDASKIYEGFKFNLGWFMSLSHLVSTLEEGGEFYKAMPDARKTLLTPLLMLYKDTAELVKQQGGLEALFQETPQAESAS